ncbi:MAG: DUF3800 domain-containing protein [Candidatus Paceibacterota bacterium]
MDFLFADETNVQPSEKNNVKFFVYGGLIVPVKSIDAIHEKVSLIRDQYGYKYTDSLKFDSRSRPDNVSIEDFSSIKNELIEYAIKMDCCSLFYVVHHEIAKNQDMQVITKWGADHIVSKFNNRLQERDKQGVVIMDRLPNSEEYGFLSEKFSTGLVYEDKTTSLDKIRLFAASCDNASNLSSMSDIVLGSFRYCVNNPSNFQAAKKMMKNLVRLIWSGKKGSTIHPFEKGLTFRPQPSDVKVPKYKSDYDTLLTQLNSLLK